MFFQEYVTKKGGACMPSKAGGVMKKEVMEQLIATRKGRVKKKKFGGGGTIFLREPTTVRVGGVIVSEIQRGSKMKELVGRPLGKTNLPNIGEEVTFSPCTRKRGNTRVPGRARSKFFGPSSLLPKKDIKGTKGENGILELTRRQRRKENWMKPCGREEMGR